MCVCVPCTLYCLCVCAPRYNTPNSHLISLPRPLALLTAPVHAILPPIALGLRNYYGDDADATPRVCWVPHILCSISCHISPPPSPLLPSLSRAARKMNRVQFVNTNFASQDVIQRKFDQFLSDLA
jgi:hypothetical protein